jgi:hypothetical protein
MTFREAAKDCDYREQAKNCRNMAKLQFDPKARALLDSVAEQFERLAYESERDRIAGVPASMSAPEDASPRTRLM